MRAEAQRRSRRCPRRVWRYPQHAKASWLRCVRRRERRRERRTQTLFDVAVLALFAAFFFMQ
eukprot:gene3112-2561_t